MKFLVCVTFLSLASSVLATSGDCVINKKHKGTGTLVERSAQDGNGTLIVLEVDIKHDRWRGTVARKDVAGTFANIDVPQAHRYATSIQQKVRGAKLNYDYLNPGYKGTKSNLTINESQDITSVTVHETIYNDFGRTEGRNTISCEF
jgi:aspartokinase